MAASRLQLANLSMAFWGLGLLQLNVCLRKTIHQTTWARTPETLVVCGRSLLSDLLSHLLFVTTYLHRDIPVSLGDMDNIGGSSVNATSIVKPFASLGRIENSLHQVNATSMAKAYVAKHG